MPRRRPEVCDRERLRTAIALVSVVAVRILDLRGARDAGSDAPAAVSDEELEAVQAARPGKPIVTVKQFVDRVVGLGGDLGRKCDGPLGWQTLWRGYQRLADIVLGYTLAKQAYLFVQSNSGYEIGGEPGPAAGRFPL